MPRNGHLTYIIIDLQFLLACDYDGNEAPDFFPSPFAHDLYMC